MTELNETKLTNAKSIHAWLGTFQGYSLPKRTAIERILTAKDVIRWDPRFLGEAEFWPSGDRPEVVRIFNHKAVTQQVLTTLWPVNDERTRDFMNAFYRDALTSGDAVAALGRTQQRLLREWRTKIGPARAARFAGPFVISAGGK